MRRCECDICHCEIRPNMEYTLMLSPRFKVAHDDPVRVNLDVCPRCAEGFTEALNWTEIGEVIIQGNSRRARRMAPSEGE